MSVCWLDGWLIIDLFVSGWVGWLVRHRRMVGLFCHNFMKREESYQRDLYNSVLSRFPESFFVLIMYCTLSLSHVWSHDLVRQWPAVHNQNKQRFLNETFKSR